jgi:hypothetical protein
VIAARRTRFVIALNSGLAFASATLITTALHEASHGFVAKALGFSPKIYPFFEDNPRGTTSQDILILAGGPVGSLVFGIAFAWMYYRGSTKYSFGRFLLCWLALLGVIEFVNYLIVTPWLSGGDTAVIADRLGWQAAPRYAVAAVGLVALFVLALPAARMMAAAAPAGTPLETPRERRRWLSLAFYIPAFAGIVLVAPATLGIKPEFALYGLLAAFGSTDIVGVSFGAARAPTATGERRRDDPIRISWGGVALYAGLLIVYTRILVYGLPL